MIHFKVLNITCVILPMLRHYESRARRTSKRGFSSLLSGLGKYQQFSNRAKHGVARKDYEVDPSSGQK
jgi:hypothetical protein